MSHRNQALGPLCATAVLLITCSALAAEQRTSEGFVDDSSLKVINRNFYFYRNYHDNGIFNGRQQNYREEWAHGIQALFSSGYTQGTVGFGLDAHALAGFKLDSGRGTSGTNLLPLDSNRRAEGEYSAAGGAIKLKAFDTEVKAGDLFPSTPVFRHGDGRLLPQSFRGVSVQNTSIDRLNLQAGSFHSTRYKASSNHDGELSTDYGGTAFKSARYLGADYQFDEATSASIYQANFEDVWNQTYLSLTKTVPLSQAASLVLGGDFYRTRDEGKALAGTIDTDSWSAYGRLSLGAHSFTVAYQRIDGDQPFDYLGDGDSIYLANSLYYSDFNSPNERSWQLRYDFNFVGVGLPGLTFMTRYIKGSDIDNTKVDPNGAYAYYAQLGSGGEHWERDTQIRYVVQSGPAKDLSITLQQTIHRANSAQADGDADQVRLITQYPLSIF